MRRYLDGRCYNGDFKDDKLHGTGKFTTPAGNHYEGTFVNNRATGTGKISYRDTSTVVMIKNWKVVFPGLCAKKAKKKRRASKDSDRLIAEIKKAMHVFAKAEESRIDEADGIDAAHRRH